MIILEVGESMNRIKCLLELKPLMHLHHIENLAKSLLQVVSRV
jgi:hypothetical protein